MTKQAIFTLLAAAAVLMMHSCDSKDDDLEDHLPVVTFTDAEVLLNGNVRVSGRLISEGLTDLRHLGFAADSVEDFNISANQLRVSEVVNGVFTAEFGPSYRLHLYEQVYIMAFGANEVGYSTSAVYALEEGAPGPPASDVPCDLDGFGFDLGQGAGWRELTSQSDVEPYFLGGHNVTFNATQGQSVSLQFRSLQNGVYTTTTANPQEGSLDMRVALVVNGQSWSAADGNEVHVNLLEPGVYTVTICGIPWWSSTGQQQLNARFSVAYE